MHEETRFLPVIVAPTFNNARTLLQVLRGIEQLGLPAIVVDDGCRDETQSILHAWQKSGPDCAVLTHKVNRGKAAAMRTGFSYAVAHGYTHAVTIDTDGQLDPNDIPGLLRTARRSPDAIVVGCRDVEAKGYPRANRLGRIATNLLVRWETGVRMQDSQCGFRVYPLKQILSIKCRTERYNFETEILTRAAWARIPIEHCPVRCEYELPEGRVSHFRPWMDSFACARVHARLLLESSIRRGQHLTDTDVQAMPGWRQLLWWMSPIRAVRMMRRNPEERARFATAVALGVFIANLPLYGVQTVLGLYAARRLRLNPLPVVLGTHLSMPPIGPLLITIAIGIGYWLRHGVLPNASAFNPSVMGYRALIQSVLLEWAMGSIVCGTILAGLTYLLMRGLLRWIPVHTPQAAVADPVPSAPILDRAVAESAA
jgi:uncharacterized protein (DUF2062 family)